MDPRFPGLALPKRKVQQGGVDRESTPQTAILTHTSSRGLSAALKTWVNAGNVLALVSQRRREGALCYAHDMRIDQMLVQHSVSVWMPMLKRVSSRWRYEPLLFFHELGVRCQTARQELSHQTSFECANGVWSVENISKHTET